MSRNLIIFALVCTFAVAVLSQSAQHLCEGVNCQNGGTCLDGVCQCTTGWFGKECSVKDLCYGVSCHSGSCEEGVCTCRKGYYGPNCQAFAGCKSPLYFVKESGLSRCDDDCDCDGERTCNLLKLCQGDPRDCGQEDYFRDETQNILGDYKCYNDCECDGKRKCENGLCAGEARDICFGVQCYNGAKCSGGKCQCTGGWKGVSCKERDLCFDVDCKNGGTCNDKDGKCACPVGFIGELCQLKDLCLNVDCGANGSCDSGKCVCRNGYYGDKCELFAGCDSPVYTVRETGLLTRCSNNCDCDGERTCNFLKFCFGDARDCGEEKYRRDESKNLLGAGNCYNSCECDGKRTCVEGVCSGEARNACYDVDCQNGGRCNNGACTCRGGWKGERCQTRDLCFNVDCQNGGSCNEGKCACPAGWLGDRCQVKDLCLNVECGHNGQCVVGTCACRNGFYGPACQEKTTCTSPIYFVRETGLLTRCGNDCDCDGRRTCNWLKFCQGDARDCGEEKYFRDETTNALGASKCYNSCECDGKRTCQNGVCAGEARSPCYGKSCFNGGSCSNGVCVCKAGWKGVDCRDQDPCGGVNCANGGTCSSGVCICPNGFFGDRCQNQDPCLNVNCNNGKCVSGKCQCNSGWQGNVCNEVVSAGCTSPNYFVNEAKNARGANKCFNDCDCDGQRTCGSNGVCQGTSRNGDYKNIKADDFCNNAAYNYDEKNNKGRCQNDCQCDGRRTCNWFGFCWGTARFI